MTGAHHKNRPNNPGEGEPEFTESLALGLGVLERFADGPRVLSLTQLTEMLGVGSPSTLHRYTAVLVARGYLEQNSARSYRLGARAGDVGLTVLGSSALYGSRRGTLRELRERSRGYLEQNSARSYRLGARAGDVGLDGSALYAA